MDAQAGLRNETAAATQHPGLLTSAGQPRLTCILPIAACCPSPPLPLAPPTWTEGEGGSSIGYVSHRWLEPKALLDLAHAGPTRKAMKLLGATDETSARAARKPKK